MDAVQLHHQDVLNTPLPPHAVNKWEALRELTIARSAFGLTDRDITVLQALLSFHPGNDLDNPSKLVVFPSNASICERLNGMPCSTMRRHLGNLVASGLILRKDSPNGKRYVRRGPAGVQAYGFDLSPLARRYPDICQAAQVMRDTAARIAELREEISLLRRDLRGLLALAEATHAAAAQSFLDISARALRRNLTLDDLHAMSSTLQNAIAQLHAKPAQNTKSEEMSISDVQNEQHQQRSKPNLYESEKSAENIQADPTRTRLPLGLVISACPEVISYASEPVQHWQGFMRLVETVRPMMGICASAWDAAKRAMGPEDAAITLAAILQRFAEIRSPGGYLRSLAAKASEGEFSSAPMIMALLRRAPGSQL